MKKLADHFLESSSYSTEKDLSIFLHLMLNDINKDVLIVGDTVLAGGQILKKTHDIVRMIIDLKYSGFLRAKSLDDDIFEFMKVPTTIDICELGWKRLLFFEDIYEREL